MEEIQSSSNIVYSKVSQGGKEKCIGVKITTLNDLKKATPRLKLPKIKSSSIASKNSIAKKEIKQKLHNYCRTCAGLKVPLVDIFSEKGIQMRLEQQMQHLETIEKNDSLSTHMCMDCICDLRMSYKFFMQMKKAEMKLKTISHLLNEVPATETLPPDVKDSLLDTSTPTVTDKFEVKSEPDEYDCTYLNDTANDGNESFEEFDPDESFDQSADFDSSSKIVTDIQTNVSYRFDKNLNAYIKIESDGDGHSIEKEDIEEIDNSDTQINKTVTISKETITKSPIKPKTSKRKLSQGSASNEDTDSSSKKSSQKVNVGLKELKIPKLDLQDGTNIKKTEDGVMYVTAKGSKPNEMLLIKVKKVNKASDKKIEKPVSKKKSEACLELLRKYDSEKNKGKDIDKQIEEYKKRRDQILGESANGTNKTPDAGDFELANSEHAYTIGSWGSPESKTNSQEDTRKTEKIVTIINAQNEETILVSEVSTDDSEQTDKMKQRWKEIKQRHQTISKDLAEDHTDRLRAVLKQKDEDIEEFKNYLKMRKIVIPRLSDNDIINLYEQKYDVVLERTPVEEIKDEIVEGTDPFDIVETYDCDFCDETFPTVEEMFEHGIEHDFKLMHYCEDCGKEFVTHKAKRCHNITCVEKLMCKYCDMILESKGKKRQHEQKHCDDQFGHLCDLCGERMKHQATLDQHVKSRHMNLEKLFKCPQCPKRFAIRTKLTFHLKSVHTNNRPFLCEDCGCNFKNPASLRHHRIRKHAPVDNKKECHICSKLVPVYGMSKHMHTHKAYSIKCDRCEKKFKNTSTLKQHMKIHEDQRQYKCDMCGVGFNRRDGLRLHLKVHDKPDSKGLKECVCQVCNQKFPSHSMLVIHRNREHKDGRSFTCTICNRSMISTRSLEWHMAHIHNQTVPGLPKEDATVDVETKRVTCMHCGKSFKTEMILRTHIKNSHTQREPLKCLDCEDTFTSEVRWKHHMMTVHERLDGTLQCPHCPKRFVNQLRLKTHMISHSDERPYACDICDFMLKTKVQLIKHKQNRHSNERPLQCRFCKWRCKQVSALVCHERTHTNERPYQCSVCKQRFKYLGDKNKHERRHEVLGGAGFKRIVTGRKTSKKVTDKRSNLLANEQDLINGEADLTVELGDVQNTSSEYAENTDDTFNESCYVKDEGDGVGEQATFEQVYITTQDSEYTEEVTTGNYEGQVIPSGILTTDIDESMLQQGAVFLQHSDDNGQIQIVPVYLTLGQEVSSSDVTLEL